MPNKVWSSARLRAQSKTTKPKKSGNLTRAFAVIAALGFAGYAANHFTSPPQAPVPINEPDQTPVTNTTPDLPESIVTQPTPDVTPEPETVIEAITEAEIEPVAEAEPETITPAAPATPTTVELADGTSIPLPIARPDRTQYEAQLAAAQANAPNPQSLLTGQDKQVFGADDGGDKFNARPAHVAAPQVVALTNTNTIDDNGNITDYAAGDIIVSLEDKKLWLVLQEHEHPVSAQAGTNYAIQYDIAVGRLATGDKAAGILGITPDQGALGTQLHLFTDPIAKSFEWPHYYDGKTTIVPGKNITQQGGINNPLGARFARLAYPGQVGGTDIGIHSTNTPDSIGTNASAGCFRLLPQDVLDFFERLPPLDAADLHGVQPNVYIRSSFLAEHVVKLDQLNSILPQYPDKAERLARIGLSADYQSPTVVAAQNQATVNVPLPRPRPQM